MTLTISATPPAVCPSTRPDDVERALVEREKPASCDLLVRKHLVDAAVGVGAGYIGRGDGRRSPIVLFCSTARESISRGNHVASRLRTAREREQNVLSCSSLCSGRAR